MVPNEPVSKVLWVPVEQVQSNDYNPNTVATNEMNLLYISILHDGYTQPIVTVHDKKRNKYIIVDGFHRYLVCKTRKDIYKRTGGQVPIVVLDKPINDRMASTVRHNRARGRHATTGMASMVFALLENGWDDAAICNEIGMEPEELLRLKHITGFSKLFEDAKYQKSWQTERQIRLRKEYSSRPPKS